MTPKNILIETIEQGGNACEIPDDSINEILDLLGEDYTSDAVENAFEEILGDLENWDSSLFEDIANALFEEFVGISA